MLPAPSPAPVRFRWRAGRRELTLVTTALFLALLLALTSLVFPWPAVPAVQAGSAYTITWQPPLSGKVGTVASITAITPPMFPPGSAFNLDLRPGQGQTYTDYVAICTSTTLPKVYIGQVTTTAQYIFAMTFHWPAAAGQTGAWSVCSYQTTGSGTGQMAMQAQTNYFTVTASPTPTSRPPDADPQTHTDPHSPAHT
jgi:hypothetical protein